MCIRHIRIKSERYSLKTKNFIDYIVLQFKFGQNELLNNKICFSNNFEF